MEIILCSLCGGFLYKCERFGHIRIGRKRMSQKGRQHLPLRKRLSLRGLKRRDLRILRRAARKETS